MVPPTLRLAVLGGSSRPGGQGPRQPWGALACAGGHWSANTCSLVAAPASITFLCFLHGFLPWGTPRPYRQDAPRWLFLTHHCDQVAVMPFTLPDPRGCDLRSTRPQITPRWRTVCPWVELEPLLQLQTISAKGCLEQRRRPWDLAVDPCTPFAHCHPRLRKGQAGEDAQVGGRTSVSPTSGLRARPPSDRSAMPGRQAQTTLGHSGLESGGVKEGKTPEERAGLEGSRPKRAEEAPASAFGVSKGRRVGTDGRGGRLQRLPLGRTAWTAPETGKLDSAPPPSHL